MVYDMTQSQDLSLCQGLILDGPVKGSRFLCEHLDFIEIPEDYDKDHEPLRVTATAEEGHRWARQIFKIILYKKVWLERGTVYAWILR